MTKSIDSPTGRLLAGLAVTLAAVGVLDGFLSFHPFAITNGLVVGSNTLDFIVSNTMCNCGYNPTGLMVELTSVPPGCQVNGPAMQARH